MKSDPTAVWFANLLQSRDNPPSPKVEIAYFIDGTLVVESNEPPVQPVSDDRPAAAGPGVSAVPDNVMQRLRTMPESRRSDFLKSGECLKLMAEDGQRRAERMFADYLAQVVRHSNSPG